MFITKTSQGVSTVSSYFRNKIMILCWNSIADIRPSFTEIIELLDMCLQVWSFSDLFAFSKPYLKKSLRLICYFGHVWLGRSCHVYADHLSNLYTIEHIVQLQNYIYNRIPKYWKHLLERVISWPQNHIKVFYGVQTWGFILIITPQQTE